MPANASASSNVSHSVTYFIPFNLHCFYFDANATIFLVFTIKQVLLVLPLCSLVLCCGVQRWWKQSATSHSDCVAYHMATMELLHILGSIVGCYGIYSKTASFIVLWFLLFCFLWYGETLFHTVTCVEHYLAIVHPVTYLSLKQKRWIRIRDVGIAGIWLLCVGFTLILLFIDSAIFDLIVLIFSTAIISYCNLSVLCVLIGPGPGRQRREPVDQAKLKAFNTSLAILGALMLRCLWNLIWMVLFVLNAQVDPCLWLNPEFFVNLPGSLVLPLLFLHRAGVLVCCRNSVK